VQQQCIENGPFDLLFSTQHSHSSSICSGPAGKHGSYTLLLAAKRQLLLEADKPIV
jgi:hypothetical protein